MQSIAINFALLVALLVADKSEQMGAEVGMG
jgi:hypothetical protein